MGGPRLRPSPIDNEKELHSLPFQELVKLRPNDNRSPQTRRYREAFSQHPKIQSIDLHNPKTSDTIQALLDLHKEGFESAWKRKLTTSIKDHVEATQFEDESHKRALLKEWATVRDRTLTIARGQKYRAKVDSKHKRGQLGETQPLSKTEKNLHHARRLFLETHIMPKLPQSPPAHFENLGTLQAAQGTVSLVKHHTSVVGSSTDNHHATRTSKAKVHVFPTKMLPSITTGETSRSRHGLAPSIQDSPHQPQSPAPQPLVDTSDPKEWQWLTDFVNS